MIQATDRHRQIAAWIASVLVHAGLLFVGGALLIRSAQVHVDPGKTSTEMDFTIEIPLTTPPVVIPSPAQPTPAPSTPLRPAPVPNVIIPTPEPEATVPIPPAPVAPPKAHVSKPATRATTLSRKQENTASKGALQAQPDDLHNEPPEYPEESKAASEQGVVLLRVEVNATGEAAAVSILRTSGYFRLDQAARRAVLHWRFHPGTMAGIPTSSEADVPVRFKLQ